MKSVHVFSLFQDVASLRFARKPQESFFCVFILNYQPVCLPKCPCVRALPQQEALSSQPGPSGHVFLIKILKPQLWMKGQDQNINESLCSFTKVYTLIMVLVVVMVIKTSGGA